MSGQGAAGSVGVGTGKATGKNMGKVIAWAGWRVAVAATLTASGVIHAQLYLDGYRFIHDIGVMFLVQASVSFAVAALFLVGAPVGLRIVGAGVALGALAGFVGSRTIGVFGFTEKGFQPAPQALISVLVEVATVALIVPTLVLLLLGWLKNQKRRALLSTVSAESSAPAASADPAGSGNPVAGSRFSS